MGATGATGASGKQLQPSDVLQSMTVLELREALRSIPYRVITALAHDDDDSSFDTAASLSLTDTGTVFELHLRPDIQILSRSSL